MEHRHAEFVDTHYEALIQRDKYVLSIADKLKGSKSLTWNEYSKITKGISKKSQMRELLNAVKSGGPGLKSAFYKALKEIMPDVIQELEGSFSQADDEKQETESHPQRAEAEKEQAETHRSENDIFRWNPSSLKHRSKIEELKSDSCRKKVGNLCFSKSNKYMIGSGGSGTVYLGLKEDGTEVAIKRICKDQQKNKKDFENELKYLQDLNLESKNIVRYVDLAEDEDFYYLALQLCDYDMENYMESLRQEEREGKDTALRKIVKEILLGLQVLHREKVIHRDIKPGNVLIDSGKNARLADFGLSRKLEEGRSTVHTARAGTHGWEATEILLNQETGYKKSSDIQVAGMLVYYILSDGKHPFGDMKDREENIKKGQHSLEDLQDIVAKDLIDWMINKHPAERPNIDEVIRHPYFWDDDSKDAVLRKLGDRPEIQNYEILAKLRKFYVEKGHTETTDPTETLTINEAFSELKIDNEKKRNDILTIVGVDLKNLWKLFNTAEEVSKDKSFSNWKSELLKIWPDINKKLPEDVLGLLRVLRNKLVHANVRNEFEERKIFDLFPDFLISLHRVAKELAWKY